jgi:hypothetical protein
LIKLWSSSKISDNLVFILRNSYSAITIIYEILKIHGPIFNSNYNIGQVLKYFENPETKMNFCHKYLKLLSDKTTRIMTEVNSPITGMLNALDRDSVMSKSVIRYFIFLNSTKPNGDKIGDSAFFTLLNNTSDATFEEISNFMQRYLTLSPNQLDFIEKEKQNEQ